MRWADSMSVERLRKHKIKRIKTKMKKETDAVTRSKKAYTNGMTIKLCRAIHFFSAAKN